MKNYGSKLGKVREIEDHIPGSKTTGFMHRNLQLHNKFEIPWIILHSITQGDLIVDEKRK